MSNAKEVTILDKKPKVSIIVPVYKVEFYLARCLRSIVEQTLEDIEIIIVDEGLKDRDRIITDEFMSYDQRIIAMHKGGGYGVCVNAGIEIARGEYIGIVESDDFIEQDMYENLYNQAKMLDAEIVKSPFYQYYDDDNDQLAPMMNELLNQLPIDHSFTLKQYPVLLATHPSIWAGIYKTEWLRKTGIKFSDRGAYLDIVFRFNTLMVADKIGWIKSPTYHWRFTNPTSTNAKWNLNASLDRWEDILSTLGKEPELLKDYEPYLLPEAFLNLFVHYDIFKRTVKQNKRIKKLRQYFSADGISKSVYMDFMAKQDFLMGNLDLLCMKRYMNGMLLKISDSGLLNRLLKVWVSLFGVLFFFSNFNITMPAAAVLVVKALAIFTTAMYFILLAVKCTLSIGKRVYRKFKYR